jgi:hypothetical protein
MTTDELADIERIKKLKAKYLRFMDQRRWDEWIALFADDATIRVMINDQQFCLWTGKAEILAGNSGHNTGNVSIHHAHTPDIEVIGSNRATGAWQLQDTYLRPGGHKDESFGYYEDEYTRIDGIWKIRSITCHLYSATEMPGEAPVTPPAETSDGEKDRRPAKPRAGRAPSGQLSGLVVRKKSRPGRKNAV